MSDTLPEDKQRQPSRVCLVCRRERPRNELFRLVKMKEVAHLVPNPSGSLPGKGIYFCRESSCLDKLQKDRKLKRLFLEKLQKEGLAWMLQQMDNNSQAESKT